MLKKIFTIILVCVMAFSVAGCKKKYTENDLYQYESQEFEICGLWAPTEITEEAFRQYKDAGFNTVSFTNHDEQPRSSENQYYLGSQRQQEVLEICKKLDMDVYINYGNTWFVRDIEGQDYFGDTPFSTHDYYSEYKDIIKGVHIADEPDKEKVDKISNQTLIDDFKKVYPNAKYIVNLIDITWPKGKGYETYDELLEHYSDAVMSQFDTPYISVDCYPFWNNKDEYILQNYYKLASVAKKHGAETTMILQSSTGSEFLNTLSEGDLRWQAYSAIAFGADNLQYYCYSMPRGNGYNYCILNEDGTPSVLYDYVKEINAEIQSFASVALAYDWDDALSVPGTVDRTYRISYLQYNKELDQKVFEDTKHYVSTQSTQDLVASRFISEQYGEAYMFVNFAKAKSDNNIVNATFKDCGAVAIYGGEGFDGTPEIVTLDENGQFSLDLNYGEGLFVIPLV